MKKFFLCLMACTLVIAPGCSKRTETLTRTERLEKDRNKYNTRGTVLVAVSPIVIAGGAAGSYLGAFACSLGRGNSPAWILGVTALGFVTLGAGIYMLGQGIHDLAKSKQIRRMQMKEAAQARALARQEGYTEVSECSAN